MKMTADDFPRGWLLQDLEAAARDVLRWHAGMRRGVTKKQIRETMTNLRRALESPDDR